MTSVAPAAWSIQNAWLGCLNFLNSNLTSSVVTPIILPPTTTCAEFVGSPEYGIDPCCNTTCAPLFPASPAESSHRVFPSPESFSSLALSPWCNSLWRSLKTRLSLFSLSQLIRGALGSPSISVAARAPSRASTSPARLTRVRPPLSRQLSRLLTCGTASGVPVAVHHPDLLDAGCERLSGALATEPALPPLPDCLGSLAQSIAAVGNDLANGCQAATSEALKDPRLTNSVFEPCADYLCARNLDLRC